MRKLLLIFIVFLLSGWTFAQSITGKVLILGSDKPIAGASIYFSGSSKGTSTNEQGLFNLASVQNKVPLIVSCIGYYSATITDYNLQEKLLVYLKPKENMMREVLIGNDGLSREEKMRIFRTQFIGTSSYAENCTINNPDDIELRYKKKSGTLIARSYGPITVKNKKLGYTINYYLDTFVFDKTHVFFAGNFLFKEDAITDVKLLKKIKRNREDAYEGSRMQFIRALWRQKLDYLFDVYDQDHRSLSVKDLLVRDSLNNKYLSLNGRIYITQISGNNPPTQLSTFSKYSYINQQGYFGPDLVWIGPMSLQRIGDMLPFEYVSQTDDRP